MNTKKRSSYIGKLNEDEKKYLNYNSLLGIILGATLTWFGAVFLPHNLPKPTPESFFSWQSLGMVIFIALLNIIYIKDIKYKKRTLVDTTQKEDTNE